MFSIRKLFNLKLLFDLFYLKSVHIHTYKHIIVKPAIPALLI